MHPGRQGLGALVGVALVVHGKQAFLYEVFHFIGPAKQVFAQIGPQMGTERPQKAAVRHGVPVQALQKQGTQHAFGITGSHETFEKYSYAGEEWLQHGEEKYFQTHAPRTVTGTRWAPNYEGPREHRVVLVPLFNLSTGALT
jgi:hypothetical protein